ncbi:GNAT family N-acetyltransferase [Pseudidiomarina insulisalsae]|uniref:GNAT family N-acetyltransferase n=1 Tax=Pseudidiomarina insulisalsae TaxID=575789 RepID=A0A432YQV9_9GAMM|nr:GNAT family N-acetyltransferase [Pseudidiomarina insulisalsae]RUO63737.1 GNAT family N-acetyltransferase [Pseudidiomarina insulisalsae]
MSQNVDWQVKAFADLTTKELYDLLQLRQEVFVVEQTCPYLDADGLDDQAFHLIGRDQQQHIVAYARLFLPTTAQPYSRIGRVISAGKVRRQGLGQELMRRAIEWCQTQAADAPIRLGAQVYLRAFYQSFGFKEISDEYLEDDIPHVDMERD